MTTFVKLICFVCSIFCVRVVAADYNYLPGSPLQLGAGFDKLTPFDVKANCVDAPTLPPPVPRAFTIDIHQANDRKDLYQESQIDMNLSASAFGNSASYKSSLESSASFSEQDIVWILTLSQTYDSSSISVTDINALAKDFLRKNGLAAFYKHCGTEYVAKETLQSSLYVFFTLHTRDSQAKTELSKTFTADVSYSGASINFGQSFHDLMSIATSKGVVDVRVASLGTGGFTELSSLILNSAGLDQVKTKVESFVGKISAANAVPVVYTTGLFSDLIGQPGPPQSQKMLELQSTYSEYVNSASLSDRIESILTNRNSTYRYLTQAEIGIYQGHSQRLYKHMVDLRANAAQCQIGSNRCRKVLIDTTWINWPESSEPNCSKWTLSGCAQCIITVRETGPFEDGKSFPFSCSRMQPGRPVDVVFEGYVTSTASVDNVVENANVYVHLSGVKVKDQTTDCATWPPSSSCADAKTDGLRVWKRFQLAGWVPTQSGTVTANVVLDRCTYGRRSSTGCEFSPPGVGTTHVGDGVVNGGLPPGASAPTVTMTSR